MTDAKDPATQVGEGFEGGLERRFREIHTTVAGKTCFTCREDLVAPELNYRIVLRCSTTAQDA